MDKKQAQKQAKQLVDGLQGMQSMAKGLMEQFNTAEMRKKMTPEQQAFMDEAEAGFNLKGQPLDQQLEQMNKILKNHGFTGNR